jgi:hypothetical protein
MRFTSSLVVPLAAAVLCGCGGTNKPQDGGTCVPAQYPCGPYGYATGAVVQDLSLSGRRDLAKDGMAMSSPVMPIQLGDYFQDKSLKVLFISLAASWCVPCAQEQPTLNQMYQNYLGMGGHVAFLQSILQDAAGNPAQQNTVDAWAKNYQTPFDMAADPMGVLGPYHTGNAFPVQMVIKLSTMTMTYSNVGGGSDDELKLAIDNELAN